MSVFKIAKNPSLVRSVPHRRDGAVRYLLSTADAAKELHVSRWRVLQFAEQGDLPCELMRSGQFVFKLKDVRRLRDVRADQAARSRDERLRLVRCRMLKVAASGDAQQLLLDFSTRLRLVGSRGKGRQVA